MFTPTRSPKKTLLILSAAISIAIGFPSRAHAYTYWKNCTTDQRLESLPASDPRVIEKIRSQVRGVITPSQDRAQCMEELEARLAYLNYSTEESNATLAEVRAATDRAWNALPADLRSADTARIARAMLEVQVCQNAIEAIPSARTLTKTQGRVLIYYPIYNQFAYLAGYRKNSNFLEFQPPRAAPALQAMRQAMRMGLDPAVGFAIGINEVPGWLGRTEVGIHSFHLASALGCEKRETRPVPANMLTDTYRRIPDYGTDGFQRGTARVFTDSELSDRILRAMEIPAATRGTGVSYLCAGMKPGVPRLMHVQSEFYPLAEPNANSSCCLQLPIPANTELTEHHRGYDRGIFIYKRLLGFEFLRQQIATLPRISDRAKRLTVKGEILERFLGMSHGILGSGAGFAISPVRLGIDTAKDPLYGFQALDYLVQSFSVHPWVREEQSKAEAELGLRVPSYLCQGEGPGLLEVRSDEVATRIFEIPRMGFLKRAFDRGQDPSRLSNSALSVFYYELKNSTATAVLMKSVIGENRFNDALAELGRRALPWARSLFDERQLARYTIELPETKNIVPGGDENQNREAIRLLFRTYMQDSEIFQARATYGKASAMDSYFTWDLHDAKRARMFGIAARERGENNGKYEPPFPIHAYTRETDVIPVTSTQFGAPGTPALLKFPNFPAVVAIHVGTDRKGKSALQVPGVGIFAFSSADLAHLDVRPLKLLSDSRARFFIEDLATVVSGAEIAQDPATGWIYPLHSVGERSEGYSSARAVGLVEEWKDPRWRTGDTVCIGTHADSRPWRLAHKLASGYALLERAEGPVKFRSVGWGSLRGCTNEKPLLAMKSIDPRHLFTRAKRGKRSRESETVWAFGKKQNELASLGRVVGRREKSGELVIADDLARSLKGRRAQKATLRAVPKDDVMVFRFDPERSSEYDVWPRKMLMTSVRDSSATSSNVEFLGELPDGRWVVLVGRVQVRAIRPEEGYLKVRKPDVAAPGPGVGNPIIVIDSKNEKVEAKWVGFGEPGMQIVVFDDDRLEIVPDDLVIHAGVSENTLRK